MCSLIFSFDRPGSVQTSKQQAFVEQFETFHKEQLLVFPMINDESPNTVEEKLLALKKTISQVRMLLLIKVIS
jgi:hypothetical protein